MNTYAARVVITPSTGAAILVPPSARPSAMRSWLRLTLRSGITHVHPVASRSSYLQLTGSSVQSAQLDTAPASSSARSFSIALSVGKRNIFLPGSALPFARTLRSPHCETINLIQQCSSSVICVLQVLPSENHLMVPRADKISCSVLPEPPHVFAFGFRSIFCFLNGFPVSSSRCQASAIAVKREKISDNIMPYFTPASDPLANA